MNFAENFVIAEWTQEGYNFTLNTVPDLGKIDYTPCFTQIAVFEHVDNGKAIPVWLMFPLNMELYPMDIGLACIRANNYLDDVSEADLI